ncbi:ABC transporter permease, partial [Candidatus Bipolaricaulota bacterium]
MRSRSIRKHKALWIGMTIFLAMSLASMLAPFLAPYSANKVILSDRLMPPVWYSEGSWSHLLGTDHVGRDILSRVMYGGSVSLLIGISSVVLQGTLGVAIGVIAGCQGGWLENILMRLVDIQLSIPFLVLALAVSAAMGSSLVNV